VRFTLPLPETLRHPSERVWSGLVIAAFLVVCALTPRWIQRLPVTYLLGGLGAAGLALLALQDMGIGLTLLVFSAATVPFSLGTGTQSPINLAMMLLSMFTGLWLVRMVLTRQVRLVHSGLNFPLLAFLAAATLSWIGGALMLPQRVILPGNILIVQAGQFAVFALTVAAFLLAANHQLSEGTLKAWTGFIVVVGILVVLYQIMVGRRHTVVAWHGGLYMWPFVLLLAQMLFNPDMDRRLKALGLGALGLWGYWTVRLTMSWKGGWVPAVLAFGMMLLLKSPRLFLVAVILLGLVFLAIGPESVVASLLANEESSANPVRWHLWLDVFRMGTRSWLLGLGPATYEYYWQDPGFESLSYQYVSPFAFRSDNYNPPAHNMFADIFAQTGALGLFFLMWALIAALRLGLRVRKQPLSGFQLGYVNAVLCGFAALIVVSFFLADWLIPYVYNVGLNGFPQSIYAWLLLGTLVQLGLRAQAGEVKTS
jgi:hypothetical protein